MNGGLGDSQRESGWDGERGGREDGKRRGMLSVSVGVLLWRAACKTLLLLTRLSRLSTLLVVCRLQQGDPGAREVNGQVHVTPHSEIKWMRPHFWYEHC